MCKTKQVVDVLDLRKVALIVNYANTYFGQTNNYFEPQNLEELKAIIPYYHDNKLKIRLVGRIEKGEKKQRHWKTKGYSNFLNLWRKKLNLKFFFSAICNTLINLILLMKRLCVCISKKKKKLSFLDFLAGGMDTSLIVTIDFTGSNGHLCDLKVCTICLLRVRNINKPFAPLAILCLTMIPIKNLLCGIC
ncbi:hypothetical protein RFI_32097 [Reticulomyxa filosa]|uniref:Uncharacterized protein n=1 Tax=Reticulomyxa filosa TaxID=46433 RepID=X6LUJ4_RETFI|nr:hypothetical protein RFI_32097 [Reticulomyxa filosa]|eukprot:ETO05299.1 hypothetical protein RFI_32097 [Reticulomyxa filosa]